MTPTAADLRQAIVALADRARAEGRRVLLEPEGYALVAALGVATPHHLFLRRPHELDHADTSDLGERVVVKVVSPELLHKTDVGGVVTVRNDPAALRAAMDRLAGRLAGRRLEGFVLSEYVAYEPSLGRELLVGVRWTEEFGPVLVVGPGGVLAEFLAAALDPARALAVAAPPFAPARLAAALAPAAVVEAATTSLRGRPALVSLDALAAVAARLGAIADLMPHAIAECEINPLVVADGRLVALDVLVTLGPGGERPAVAPRPLEKMRSLLEPRSLAIVGVSGERHPGRIILRNVLREGFDPRRLYVVKPGVAAVDGCPAVPDVASLPERVDLLVVAVSAPRVPPLVAEVVAHQKAESLILVTGGLDETTRGRPLAEAVRTTIAAARATAWGGPLVNGPNCLGIRSKPGRYDTLFIPDVKLPAPAGAPSPVAVIAQSGAFAVARASKLARLAPTFIVTAGNQMDVTIGDYLAWLGRDASLEVFAVYVEGFRPLDGARFLEAAAEIVASGRVVVLYRAGRTPAGRRAAASHTASIAGDYALTRALAARAGVVVAETLEEFEDLVSLFVAFRGRTVAGLRLGAVSNAGFECVAMADHLGALTLAELSDTTRARLADLLRAAGVETVVELHNPLDLTPMAADDTIAAAVEAVLTDPGVDLGIVGCVPLTPALQTLPPGPGHREDVGAADAIARRLGRLAARIQVPWVAVVDAGPLYDPMVRLLEEAGIPTFRSADRALRRLAVFAQVRLRQATLAAA
jgi:acyl-CoA synthetase (NDP forming)